MGAITERYGIANAELTDAGADLLLICHTLPEQRLAQKIYIKAQNSKET